MTGSNLLQTVVTVLGAIAVAAAALVASDAAGGWQGGVREEVKRSAAMVEDLRYVYGHEAPLALELALSEARAEAGNDADGLTERQVAFHMRRGQARRGDALADERYRRPGGWYDVPRHLADERAGNAALVRLDPERSTATADRKRDLSALIAAATVPLVALYLLAELVLRARSRRRAAAGRAAEAAVEDVGLVPRPWSSPSRRRFGVTVALIAWLAVMLLPVLQLRFTNDEQRSAALAARLAVKASTAIEASGLLASFQAKGNQEILLLRSRALARRYVALGSSDARLAAELRAMGRAAEATTGHAQQIVAAMARPPAMSDGVDRATVAAVRATPAEADAIVAEQNRQTDVTERAGRRGSRVNIALLLAALTLSLSALAATNLARRLTIVQYAAAGVLVLSLSAALSVLFV